MGNRIDLLSDEVVESVGARCVDKAIAHPRAAGDRCKILAKVRGSRTRVLTFIDIGNDFKG